MTLLVDIASWILLTAGAAFYLIGAIGMVRMPDVFTRMHAVSVLETLGAGLLIAGMILQAGISLVTLKLVVLLGLFFFVNPVATHALTQAALHDGVVPELDPDQISDEPPDELTAAALGGPRRTDLA